MESFTALSHRAQVGRLKRLAAAALAEYDLPGARLAPLVHGFNTTFQVADAGGHRYALRITRPGKSTVAEVQSELAWLEALHRDTDLVVPDPVPTRAGALLTLAGAPGVPEPRICALFRWVPGRFVQARLRPHHLTQVGRLMARLQDHAQGFQPPPGFTRPRIADLPATRAAIVPLLAGVRPPGDVALVEAALDRVAATLDGLGQGPDAYGLIHSDLHQWNYLFQHGQIHLLDFDDCGYAPFLYDLAVTTFELEDVPSFPALRAALLAGYGAARPLPPNPEAVLTTLTQLRGIQNLVWDIGLQDDVHWRDRWQQRVTRGLDRLRAFLAGGSGG
ncbi:MAG TPA: phosphotransferase [Chloroflexia bacterium]|nr:phosphotransferase [Chloroflexia bacterium]